MYHVWDGTEWNRTKALKVWTGSAWNKTYKFKVRTSTAWIPVSTSDRDESVTIRWSVEAPTPPPPPPPTTYEVPNLDGLTVTAALNALDAVTFSGVINDPYIVTTNQALDNTVVPGSQNPPAGSQAVEFSNVTFSVYEFVQPQTTVPNLDGLLTSQADTAITNANLLLGNPLGTEETYDTSKINRVIVGSQYPIAGDLVDVGTSVVYDYYIQKPFATVPNLVGQDEGDVFTLLNNANLSIGNRTTFATADQSLDGKVKSTYPVAGTQVQQDSEVDYVVYEKSLSVVPNLNGLTELQATQAIEGAGLYVGNITEQETTVIADEGKVKANSQSPAAGTQVSEGSNVNFTLWVANTTIAVPNVVGMNMFDADTLLRNTYELNVSLRNITYTNTTSQQYKVYAQSPTAGQVVNIYSIVYLDVYLPFPTYTVPSIIGLTPQSVGTPIDSNFTWGSNSLAGTGTELTSNFGKVATQSPGANTSAQAQAINYGVYTDARPTVPNVLGQTEATAKTNINNAGLNWSVTTKTNTSSSNTAGTVATQSPTAGTRLASGGTVSIEVWGTYQPQPVTRTASVSIGWGGDIAWEWQASYRDTIGASSSLTDGGRRTTSQPFYVGRFDSTNEKQHMASTFAWNTFDSWCKANKTGGASFTVTAATLRVWANSGVGGNDNPKSLRVGSYPSDVSSSPSVMAESDIFTRGIVLSISSRGTYGYATANATLISDCFTAPNYPVVVYAPNTSIDNYIVNDSDVRWDITIQWTEYV
jgi:beta-lactam-binding protein with PASTA domain